MLEQIGVDQALGAFVKRRVNSQDIALGDKVLEVCDAACAELLLALGQERVVVVVEELLAVEGLETLKDAVADAARANRADDLALELP